MTRKTVLSTLFRMSRKAQERMLTSMFTPKIQRFFRTQFVLPTQWIKLMHTLDSQHKGWTLNLEATKDDFHYEIQLKHLTIRKAWMVHFRVWYKDDEARNQIEKLSFDDAHRFYKMVFFILVRLPKSTTYWTRTSRTKFMITDFLVGRRSIISMRKGWTESDFYEIVDKLQIILPVKPVLSRDFLVDEDAFLVRFLNAPVSVKKTILIPQQAVSTT